LTGIARVELSAYRKPYRRAVTNGRYTYNESRLVLARVICDDGITGTGWVPGGDVVFAAAAEMAPLLLGEDPLAVERIWARLYQPKLVGRRGLTTRAISLLDIALWDGIGRRLGVSIHRLMGAYRERIPAYAAGGYYEEGKGLSALVEEMAGYVAEGFHAVKMKVGALTLAEDTERVRAVRQAVGDDVELLVDANGAYSTFAARAMARALAEQRVFWFEEPLSPDNLDGYRLLVGDGCVPIAHGENEYTRFGFRDVIRAGAADILNPDAQVLGGITEMRHVVSLIAAQELCFAPHGDQHIHVHLAAGLPGGLMLECYHERVTGIAAEMVVDRLELAGDGTVAPPDGPGLGVRLDDELLAHHLERSATVPA
jgi:D-arabinonate dehydratase